MAKLNKNGVKTEDSVAEHIHSCGYILQKF